MSDTTGGESQELFVKKLQQCASVVFDFSDPVSDLKSKELKRSTLNELIDYVANAHGFLNETTYSELVRLVSANAFRPLPPHDSATELDPEDDEPNPEPSWPHLQVCTQLFLTFLIFKENLFKNFNRVCACLPLYVSRAYMYRVIEQPQRLC